MVLHYLTHANTETQWKELLRNSKWQVTQQSSRSYVCKCQSDLFSLSASKQDVIVVGLTREIRNYWAIVDCVNWLWEWCFIVKSCIVLLFKLWWYDNTPPPFPKATHIKTRLILLINCANSHFLCLTKGNFDLWMCERSTTLGKVCQFVDFKVSEWEGEWPLAETGASNNIMYTHQSKSLSPWLSQNSWKPEKLR